MDGYGIYTWKDGRKFEGQYREDKKHGFGIYEWSDGRKYEGQWFKGKQHGIGTYYVPDEATQSGLWEDGKRIEWFTDEIIGEIQGGSMVYAQWFKKAESSSYIERGARFDAPTGFNQAIKELKDTMTTH